MLFSRQVPPLNEPIHLNRIVQDGLYLADPLLKKSNVKTTCRFDEDLPRIPGDPGQMRQVAVNLIVNAVQAMDGSGEITITTCREANGVILTIADSGKGMDDETRKKCFLPFFTTKDVDQGTGLGLSVVHGIIQAHGGSITVESQPGAGTKFTIWFPVTG